jgi:hypothetical protein
MVSHLWLVTAPIWEALTLAISISRIIITIGKMKEHEAQVRSLSTKMMIITLLITVLAGRFGHQHVYNNYYEDFHYQAIHSRCNNQVLVEGNVFRGDTHEALSTYGLVIPDDSPNTSPLGDPEPDGYANLGAGMQFEASLSAGVNLSQRTIGDRRRSILLRRATLLRFHTRTRSLRSRRS